LVLSAILIFFPVFAESIQKVDPTLKLIENKIRSALADIESELNFEHPATTSLIIKYKTRAFTVHSRYKTGKISQKAYGTEGPTYIGFMLSVNLEEVSTLHQAVGPQRLDRIYWVTDLNHTTIKKTDIRICWRLPFGTRTDQKMLDKIRQILMEFSK
jgi:hypothetical protein